MPADSDPYFELGKLKRISDPASLLRSFGGCEAKGNGINFGWGRNRGLSLRSRQPCGLLYAVVFCRNQAKGLAWLSIEFWKVRLDGNGKGMVVLLLIWCVVWRLRTAGGINKHGLLQRDHLVTNEDEWGLLDL